MSHTQFGILGSFVILLVGRKKAAQRSWVNPPGSWSFPKPLLSLINTSHLFNGPDIPTYEGIDLLVRGSGPPITKTPLSSLSTNPKTAKAAAYANNLTGLTHMRGASHILYASLQGPC